MLHWDLLFLPDFFFIGNSYIHSTLISGKPFFIFNEPLSSLDSHSRQTMFISSSHRKKKITQTRIYLHLYLSQFIPSFKTPNLNFSIRTQLSPLQPNLFSFAIQSLLQNTIFDKYSYNNAVDENESGRKNIRFGLWLGILIKLEEVGDKKNKNKWTFGILFFSLLKDALRGHWDATSVSPTSSRTFSLLLLCSSTNTLLCMLAQSSLSVKVRLDTWVVLWRCIKYHITSRVVVL